MDLEIDKKRQGGYVKSDNFESNQKYRQNIKIIKMYTIFGALAMLTLLIALVALPMYSLILPTGEFVIFPKGEDVIAEISQIDLLFTPTESEESPQQSTGENEPNFFSYWLKYMKDVATTCNTESGQWFVWEGIILALICVLIGVSLPFNPAKNCDFKVEQIRQRLATTKNSFLSNLPGVIVTLLYIVLVCGPVVSVMFDSVDNPIAIAKFENINYIFGQLTFNAYVIIPILLIAVMLFCLIKIGNEESKIAKALSTEVKLDI